jgi:predicted nucleic acid-binding protein
MRGSSQQKEEQDQGTFFDANILAYAFDDSEASRREKCTSLVRSGFQGDAVCLVSNQVLSELFVVLTKHAKKPLPKEKAGIIVNGFVDSSKWIKINYTHLTVKRALIDLEAMNVPFWDLLIAETMREARIRTIYTENERDFAKIPWVEVVNPIRN